MVIVKINLTVESYFIVNIILNKDSYIGSKYKKKSYICKSSLIYIKKH